MPCIRRAVNRELATRNLTVTCYDTLIDLLIVNLDILMDHV